MAVLKYAKYLDAKFESRIMEADEAKEWLEVPLKEWQSAEHHYQLVVELYNKEEL